MANLKKLKLMLSNLSNNLQHKISWLLISLAGIAFLVFFNAINHPFVHDDVVFIVQNPHIAHLDQLGGVFLNSSNLGVNVGINSYYRPILEVFYRLEYVLFGFNPAGFHFVNIFIHIINGLLVFALLSSLLFSSWLAFSISAVFLIHPVQTEAVACIAGISNLLSTMLVLLVLFTYKKEKYLWAILSFILALLTKEQVVIVPILLVLLDWYAKKRNRYGWWACFFLITAGFLWLRAHITGAHMLEDILQSPGELRLRILAIPRTIVMYLRLIGLPYGLHYYRNTDILAANSLGFVILGSLLAGLFWLVKKAQMNARDIVFGVAWFMICVFPVLNIVPLVNEYSFILTAEHFLYLPMVGIVMIVGLIVQRFVPAQKLVIVGIVLCLALGLQSIYQNSFWKGEIPLFERMVQFEPNFARGQLLLANAYRSNKEEDLAMPHYQRALEIMKGYRQKSTNLKASMFYDGFIKGINCDLAQSLLIKRNFEGALSYYKEALRIDPQDVSILNNMAICYINQGDKIQAEGILKLALGINPAYIPARDNLNSLVNEK